MAAMFSGATSLADISGLANWDTSSVTGMGNMFNGTKIINTDALVPNKNNNPNIWNTSNVTNMGGMFNNCSSLTDITGLSNWVTTNLTSMSSMFQKSAIVNVNALATGKNNNPNIWNISSVTSMREMFKDVTSLVDITGLSDWDTSSTKDMASMFSGATSLVNITGLSNWNTKSATSMHALFANTAITNVNALATGKNSDPDIWNVENVTNISNMFADCTSLTDITGLSNWNTAEVTSMAITFSGCSSLTDITGLSNWDTAKVTNMSSMFCNTKITTLDALEPGKNNNPNIWNTGKVSNMYGTFDGCTSLTDISKISGWDVSKVTATAGDATSNNKFYFMFNKVPTITTSGFSFTNRAGSINTSGTYVPNN